MQFSRDSGALRNAVFHFQIQIPQRLPVSLDFMAVSSYAKGTTSSGEVRVLEVKFADGTRAVVPRTNIEVIEG